MKLWFTTTKRIKMKNHPLFLALACRIKASSVFFTLVLLVVSPFFAWPLAAQNFDNETIDEIVILGSRISTQSVLTTPAPKITLTLDAYQIDIDDRIILSNQVAAVALDSEPQQIFAYAGATKAQFFINGPDTRTRGLDVVAEWSPQISHGTLETKLAWNMTETEVTGHFRLQGLLNGLSQDLLFTERDRDIIEAWQPEERLTLSANWKLNRFTVQGDVNRYGSYLSSEGSGNNYVTQNHDAAYIVNTRLHFDVSPSIRLSFWGDNITDQYPEKNTISAARSGTIKGIVDSPNGVFQYSLRTAPYGFNGAFWGMSVKHSF